MDSFFEYKENIPVIDNYDVLVMGGGVSGISASVSAARKGCKVLLIEKLCNAGGLATGGLISYYLPICDGCGKVVSRGIAEELLQFAVDSAPGKICGNAAVGSIKSNRIQSYFYPAVFQTVIDGFLEENGVDVLFDASADAPLLTGKHCGGIIINRREGRALYKAKMFVDTTGDASVMQKAGAAVVDGLNLLSGWYYTLSSDGYYKLCSIGADAHGAYVSINSGRTSDTYKGLTSSDISKYVIKVKKEIWKEEQIAVKAGEKIIASIPSVPQLRFNRRITGVGEISEKDRNTYCKTSVGCVSDWRSPGIVYEVPFEILISSDTDNIITAGRTVSASGEAYENLRCIPQCAVTGEAAGAAAALCCLRNLDKLTDLKIPELQASLKETGTMIHYHH